ncbi:4Fe-4S single cluster domain-containing protein [Streptomyces griseoloalbus]|uniref:Anaerobic ribonucleoside-triphosphate reductase activating protein n=1 Tax=Streptomyces griseoloalbus TaxID=67303 RepID=A0A7W8FBK0_9ACTN|nr:4Fe-4S single cluster domain-containing protein [Streptomyces albaduncus]MBB5128374.1 anaerobic ribonucleoside-triphosphate reductase activating protein [Streptomyces albaduncus]GGW73926.1 radical activating enzyme [Streptomyces albaduncus]
MKARISGTHFPLGTLGPGQRLGIWFQGCALACPGCMSRHTWPPEGGTAEDVSGLLRMWEEALGRGAEGLTVSGGEPLDQPDALTELLLGAARIRDRADGGAEGADLLVYTGYEPDELTAARRRALRGADAVITGRFRVERPTRLVWRGSANQRLRPLTPRGETRYASHLARESTGGRLQAVVEPGPPVGVRFHGVPLRGELRAVEQGLREAGVTLRDPSWRP